MYMSFEYSVSFFHSNVFLFKNRHLWFLLMWPQWNIFFGNVRINSFGIPSSCTLSINSKLRVIFGKPFVKIKKSTKNKAIKPSNHRVIDVVYLSFQFLFLSHFSKKNRNSRKQKQKLMDFCFIFFNLRQ